MIDDFKKMQMFTASLNKSDYLQMRESQILFAKYATRPADTVGNTGLIGASSVHLNHFQDAFYIRNELGKTLKKNQL